WPGPFRPACASGIYVPEDDLALVGAGCGEHAVWAEGEGLGLPGLPGERLRLRQRYEIPVARDAGVCGGPEGSPPSGRPCPSEWCAAEVPSHPGRARLVDVEKVDTSAVTEDVLVRRREKRRGEAVGVDSFRRPRLSCQAEPGLVSARPCRRQVNVLMAFALV